MKDREKDVTLVGLIDRTNLRAIVQGCTSRKLSDDSDLDSGYGLHGTKWPSFRDSLSEREVVSPLVVNESMPADKIYRWFISSSVRRLIVVKDGSLEVTGVITRHDIHETLRNWPSGSVTSNPIKPPVPCTVPRNVKPAAPPAVANVTRSWTRTLRAYT